MKQSQVLNDLKQRTERFIEQTEKWKSLTQDQLNWRESSEKWSVLQCLEHLNLYGDFYLPEFEKRILAATQISSDLEFKGGWFAEKTANGMLPKDNKLSNSMNTFKNMNPEHSALTITILDRFLKQQHQMLSLLDQAQKVDIKKVKCNLTLPIIKFNLGSTFKFVIYHNERHLWQASNVLNQQR
ncbi:MAG: DinB family protein [Salibacteraceae bacterium]|jgi:hypothetical protein|nr:DinB family protein [Salibacteraceae bacterium]